jgi:hypothetical protein
MIRSASLHAGFQLVPNAAGSNADRVHRQSQFRRYLAPAFYLSPLFACVVFQDQCAVPRIEFLQAAVEAIEKILVMIRLVGGWVRSWIRGYALQQFKVRVRSLRTPQILEKHELRNDVTISSRWRIPQRIILMETPHHPVESFVREIVGMLAILAVEISRKPAVHFQVTRALGIAPFVKPLQELLKPVRIRSLGTNWLKSWNA